MPDWHRRGLTIGRLMIWPTLPQDALESRLPRAREWRALSTGRRRAAVEPGGGVRTEFLVAFSLLFFGYFSQSLFGVVQSRLHRARSYAGNLGDLLDGKTFDEMHKKHGTLQLWQMIQPAHEFLFAFLPYEQIIRTSLGLGRSSAKFIERVFLSRSPAPVLDAFLVGDAKKPGAEFVVIAQVAD